MAWLKRMNARGFDVLVRPDGAHGLVLLDGLNKADLQLLREWGFAPSALVDPGAGQYQAWVKLSVQPLAEPLRSLAAVGMVEGLSRHGAQAVSRADGRLAGFTNQQEHRPGGRHPYVLMAYGESNVAPAAPAYLARLQQLQEKTGELTREKYHRQSSGPER
jgi:hypothetical protein